MIGRSRYPVILILLILALASSCNNDVIYSDVTQMSDKTWNLSEVPVFNVPVSDTINNSNIYFIIRTGTSYPFRNIFLFVSTTSPDGKMRTDTLQYYLADEKGKWFGKGFGDIHELKLPYRTNVFFPQNGIYQFKVQHGMRIEDLKGVYDFGLRIENTGK